MFTEALDIFRTHHGSEHYSLGIVLRNRATLYRDMRQGGAAERDAREALEILTATYGEKHWRIADAESVLGACLLDLDQRDEAEPLLRRGLTTIEAEKEPGDRIVREARSRVAEL